VSEADEEDEEGQEADAIDVVEDEEGGSLAGNGLRMSVSL